MLHDVCLNPELFVFKQDIAFAAVEGVPIPARFYATSNSAFDRLKFMRIVEAAHRVSVLQVNP